MDTTHYYFQATYGTKLKNNLQRDLYDYLVNLDGLIIEEESLKNFLHNINKKATELSEKHSRCKPIVFDTFKVNSASFSKNLFITGFEQMNLCLLGGSLWYMTDKKA